MIANYRNLSKVKDTLLTELDLAQHILAINPSSVQGVTFKRSILESFTTTPITLSRAAVVLTQAAGVARHDSSVKNMFESCMKIVNKNRNKFDLLTAIENIDEAKASEYQKTAIAKLDTNIRLTGQAFSANLLENYVTYSQLGQAVVQVLTEARSKVLSEAKHLVTPEISVFNPVSVTEKSGESIVFRIENTIFNLTSDTLSIGTSTENFVTISNLIEEHATYDIDNKSFIVKLKDSTATISDDKVIVDGVEYSHADFIDTCMTGDNIARWSMDGCSTAIALVKNWSSVFELDTIYQFSNTQGDVGFIACLPKTDGGHSYYTAICKSVRWPIGLTKVDSVAGLIEFSNVCFGLDVSNMDFIQKCIETEFETVSTTSLELATIEEKLRTLNTKRDQVLAESKLARTKDAIAIYNEILGTINEELATVRKRLLDKQ